MVAFIDAHRDAYGIERICRMLPIAPSTHDEHKAREVDPTRRPARARQDETLRGEIRRAWRANFTVYGVRKVWKQLRRDGHEVARCTVARLMWQMGLQGAVRDRKFKTTIPDTAAVRPPDLVECEFIAARPNQPWVADLAYVATWRGFVYVAFVVDTFARRIGGRRASNSLRTDLALDTLRQASYERCGGGTGGLVHHGDRGVQYLSIRYTERLAGAGIAPPVGSPGDSHDDALAESVIGLFKPESICRRGPWRSLEDVEFAVLQWVAWFNQHRLLAPIR